jgi:hypothetical protein
MMIDVENMGTEHDLPPVPPLHAGTDNLNTAIDPPKKVPLFQ